MIGLLLCLKPKELSDYQGCQNASATGAIAGYSEVFAGEKGKIKDEKNVVK